MLATPSHMSFVQSLPNGKIVIALDYYTPMSAQMVNAKNKEWWNVENLPTNYHKHDDFFTCMFHKSGNLW